ncbi:alpha/beta hydrolase [Phormidium tenue FACHB-886]|nr:alpha/beta hydrolase [Phormidium tenue FACHB-886]
MLTPSQSADSQPTGAQPQTQFYTWQGHTCAYEVWLPAIETESKPVPLLLLHPIGVGLSRRFWDRFIRAWREAGHPQSIYNPDLLGCGESAKPHIAYTPEDWAAQLEYLIDTVIQQPVILVVQGALFPVAIALAQRQASGDRVRGLILSGPPAWAVMTKPTPEWQQKLTWNLFFDSPVGRAFYQYAQRRQFIQSFSVRQLFAEASAVDDEWLSRLETDAKSAESRYAVFSFLAGFWRRNWAMAIQQLTVPTLVVVGDHASSISQSGKGDTPSKRIDDYLHHMPQTQGLQISGRNVLPYESTDAFVEAIAPFIERQG